MGRMQADISWSHVHLPLRLVDSWGICQLATESTNPSVDVIFLFEHAQLNLPGIISMGHRTLQAAWKGGGMSCSSASEEKLPIPECKLCIGNHYETSTQMF